MLIAGAVGVALDSRRGVAPGHYEQYCHRLRVALGVVHPVAVLPIAAPPDPAPAILTHEVGFAAPAAEIPVNTEAGAVNSDASAVVRTWGVACVHSSRTSPGRAWQLPQRESVI